MRTACSRLRGGRALLGLLGCLAGSHCRRSELAGEALDAALGVYQLLTAREQEILGLMAAGMTNPQIAAQLVIGAGTVKTHALHIYRKLEVANRIQAIDRAQALGILLERTPACRAYDKRNIEK